MVSLEVYCLLVKCTGYKISKASSGKKLRTQRNQPKYPNVEQTGKIDRMISEDPWIHNPYKDPHNPGCGSVDKLPILLLTEQQDRKSKR